MNYIVAIKTLKNDLLSNTVQELKDKLKTLGAEEETIKKSKTKKECYEAVLELL